jgi:hypothetical protein
MSLRRSLSLVVAALAVASPLLVDHPSASAAGPTGQREFFADTFADPLDYSNEEDVALVDEALIVGVSEQPTMSDGQLHLKFNKQGYFSPLWGGYDVGGHAKGSDAVGHDREGNARRLDGRFYTKLRVRMNVSAAVGAGIFFYDCVAGVNDVCQSGQQFVTERGWREYTVNVPAKSISGIRIAISPDASSGPVTTDVDWVQVVDSGRGTGLGNTAPDGSVVGPLPEVLNPDAAGAIPLLFPLSGKPIPYTGTNCPNNDWASRVRGDAWDFSEVTDAERVENYTSWSVIDGQFNGIGATAPNGDSPGDPGIRLGLNGRTIDPKVWHRTTLVVPFWDGRYSQQFSNDGGWVFRTIWKFVGDERFQISAPMVEYPNDTTISADQNDPTPFDGSEPPPLNINDTTVNGQLGWSRPGLRIKTFRVDISEPYKPRQTPVDSVFLSTDDCGVDSADIVFRDNNGGDATSAEFFASPSPQGPWNSIGSAPVASGLNTWTWRNAPKGTWWIKVGMTRGSTYGENMSTGPVTIGTDFSDVIKAEAALGGSGAPSKLALRPIRKFKKVRAR